MRITVIGMVKNSADIIESYIRCNASFADNFVLLDNLSTDRTKEILNSLNEEGFDIEIIEDNENSYHQSEKMNRLLRYVIEKYDSDYIIPLDDDEILISSIEEQSVRDIVELLPTNELHYAYWKMYIPTSLDSNDEVCVPLKMRFRMDDTITSSTKIIIPKQVVDDTFVIAQGNHYGDGKLILKDSYTDKLRVAHYPIRSEEQIKSKALIGWTNYLMMPDRKANQGVHWKAYYDYIKENGSISVESMQMMVLSYYASWDVEKINIISDPVVLPEECFIIRYTNKNEINALKNYMTHVECIIDNIEK